MLVIAGSTKNRYVSVHEHSTRADQNMGGSILKSPVRTAMHKKSRVSSAISVELN